ncbi:hypothetical protein D9M71_299250 [compost metagenome]
MSETLVTLYHLRTVPTGRPTPGHCAGASREWFGAHGLDWREFCRNGLPAAAFDDTDTLGRELAQWARENPAPEADDGR